MAVGEGSDLADALLGDSLSVAEHAGGGHPFLRALQVGGELAQEVGAFGLRTGCLARLGSLFRVEMTRGVGGAELAVTPALSEIVGPALVGW